MRRYIVFANEEYEACGGWSDLITSDGGKFRENAQKSSDFIDEVRYWLRQYIDHYPGGTYHYQIVDLHTGRVVESG